MHLRLFAWAFAGLALVACGGTARPPESTRPNEEKVDIVPGAVRIKPPDTAPTHLAPNEVGIVPSAVCAKALASGPTHLAPDEDCAYSALQLYFRDRNGNLPERMEGTAVVAGKSFAFACRAEAGVIAGDSFDPGLGGNQCQPCAVTLFSGLRGWQTESVLVKATNPTTGSSAIVGPVDVTFAYRPCGIARLPITL